MLGNGEGRWYEMCSVTRLQLYGSVEGVYRDVLYSICRVVMVMGGGTKCVSKCIESEDGRKCIESEDRRKCIESEDGRKRVEMFSSISAMGVSNRFVFCVGNHECNN